MKNIYIILSQTGTLFSEAIRWYTRDPYNHASISFDSNLEVMYSFGRKRRYNILDSGFVIESFSKGVYDYFPNARCCILEVSVTEAEYEAMHKLVKYFCNNQHNYRYNLMGVLGHTVGIGLTRKDQFFCSQFVSFILNKTEFWNSVPELTTPMDFYWIPNKKLLYEGSVRGIRDLSVYAYSI